jgi:hypothetical protein
VSDLKEKIIQQTEEAFILAKNAKNVEGMARATEMLMRIWLEEASRYAQVPAAPLSAVSTSTSYSVGQSVSWNGDGLDIPTCGQCTCGAEELPRPGDEARAKALAATLNPKDEAVGVQTLIGIDLSVAGTSELHSGAHDLNGDGAV